jgi:hypothetical protein
MFKKVERFTLFNILGICLTLFNILGICLTFFNTTVGYSTILHGSCQIEMCTVCTGGYTGVKNRQAGQLSTLNEYLKLCRRDKKVQLHVISFVRAFVRSGPGD